MSLLICLVLALSTGQLLDELDRPDDPAEPEECFWTLPWRHLLLGQLQADERLFWIRSERLRLDIGVIHCKLLS